MIKTISLQGRRVLVTGAAGFIGSHLVEGLVQAGANVRALVRYTSTGSRGWLDRSLFRSQVEFIHGDLRDPGLVEKAANGCDSIFHLGALIGIPYSYDAPESYIQTNILGTLHVLKAAMAKGVRRVLHTSTSEVYGTAIYSPIDGGIL